LDDLTVDYSAISPEDLVLACFRTDNELAWAEFVRRFQPLIAKVVLRIAHQWGETSAQTIDDLIQETYLKLCADRGRLLRTFKPRYEGAIFSYIKVFTANLAHDHFKGLHSQKRGGRNTIRPVSDGELECVPSCTISEASLLERKILLGQVDACLRTVAAGAESDRDRKIFWLYYRSGLTAGAIASLPNIELSTKGVESVLLRLTRLVRDSLGCPEPPSADRQEKGIRSADSLS
jgi:RNA polymerase sigma-70 factor, ECF subfamily